ncbi:glycosyltransferase family 4 protein [Halomarina oriensis]|uniref:Glycosyltransferase n=1 Tax=Halomarina oriensis TaxID=671145 RepID=A0A6B0GHB8_9EURY|nr:glycosyltransferase family 4 protein [Halomarina oriensis]MWG33161.1 glycosyltransferase [Halomarina oriensis]
MHVGMILRGTFPHDIRVEKEARSLSAAGHTVSLLCLAREDDDGSASEPLADRFEDVDVVRIPRRERYTSPYRTAKTVRYLLTLTDVIWRREIERFVRERHVDTLHVHDLPLVRTAQSVADDHGLPLVADLHENYPEAARQWRTGMGEPRRTIQRTFTPYRRLRRLERECVERADHVLATTPAGRAHYIEDCDADPERVHVVSNTVDFGAYDTAADPIPGYEDEFVVSYVGSFGPHRGLEQLIDAMPRLVGQVPNARLLVVGSAGEDVYERSLHERAAATGVGDRITFPGWVDFADVPRYVAASDVCAVLHTDNPHTATTVPHKLFQYMASRKPVVVTEVETLASVVRETDSGVVVPEGDPETLAARLVELAEDDTLAERLATNGRAATEKTYNWEREAGTLWSVYDSLGADGDSRPERPGRSRTGERTSTT